MFNNIKLNDIIATTIIIFIFYKIITTLFVVIEKKTIKIKKTIKDGFVGNVISNNVKTVKTPSTSSNVKYIGNKKQSYPYLDPKIKANQRGVPMKINLNYKLDQSMPHVVNNLAQCKSKMMLEYKNGVNICLPGKGSYLFPINNNSKPYYCNDATNKGNKIYRIPANIITQKGTDKTTKLYPKKVRLPDGYVYSYTGITGKNDSCKKPVLVKGEYNWLNSLKNISSSYFPKIGYTKVPYGLRITKKCSGSNKKDCEKCKLIEMGKNSSESVADKCDTKVYPKCSDYFKTKKSISGKAKASGSIRCIDVDGKPECTNAKCFRGKCSSYGCTGNYYKPGNKKSKTCSGYNCTRGECCSHKPRCPWRCPGIGRGSDYWQKRRCRGGRGGSQCCKFVSNWWRDRCDRTGTKYYNP